ncbi:MAG: hypothetical protein EU531_08460 [Promethearchaeota archaeon]|nr:MAG: hypothetical protein EU531_08460 [Candidatus Lokiarchaeota archaeon]
MEDPFLKQYIVGDIIKEIEREGFSIEKVFVEDFIDNFQEKYNRLPKKVEIKPIARSYLKMLGEDTNYSEINNLKTEKTTLNEEITPVINQFLKKRNIINTFTEESLFRNSGEILTIPKTEGRRICPICGNDDNFFKIHEKIDKNYIISHYPKIYGKSYHCDACSCTWRES